MKGKVNSKKIKKTKDQNSAVLILSIYLNNPNIGYKLSKKEIYTVDKSKFSNKNVLVENIALKNPKNDFSYEIKDPWLFWYYFNRNIISEYSYKNKDTFDVILNSENINDFIK
jgi:putative Holliday junction resolvase